MIQTTARLATDPGAGCSQLLVCVEGFMVTGKLGLGSLGQLQLGFGIPRAMPQT